MKYIAILKDSLREAMDSKVLYVMMALSTVAILGVATIGFTPAPAEKTMQQFFIGGGGMPLTVMLDIHKPQKQMGRHAMRGQDPRDMFHLKNVELLRGDADQPESEYALTISGHRIPGLLPVDEIDEKAKLEAVRAIFKEAEEFDYLVVTNVEAVKAENEGDANQYRVVLHGTSRMRRIWASEPMILWMFPVRTGPIAVGFQLYILTSLVLSIGAWVAMIVGVIITSFYIPNMLRKGTVDLLLVKPIQRWLLLIYKYIGGMTFIFLNTVFAIGGIWFVLGIRTGVWANTALLVIPTLTFFFAILYSISTFVGVITRSTVTAIMVTIGAWVVFFLIGFAHNIFNAQHINEQELEKQGMPIPADQRWGDGWFGWSFRVAHAITPRTADLDKLDGMLVFTGFMTGNLMDIEKFDTSDRNWWESLLVSSVWIGIFLGLAALWFTYKDY